MANEVTTKPTADIMERVLLVGDLAKLTPDERVKYYGAVCESVGLNPLTKPFDFLSLNGKLILYANRNCGDQLRKINGVSIEKLEQHTTEGVYVVTAYARDKTGRTDSSIGAVPLGTLKGEALANALMKCETKAKRRVTLSICGLSFLDETEVDSIPGAQRVQADAPSIDQIAMRSMAVPTAPRPPVRLIERPAPGTVVDISVAQPSPPDEPLPPPPADQADIILPATKQAIFKAVPQVNKRHGAGMAQRVILELHPNGCDPASLTEAQGQALLAALNKGLE